MLCVECRNVRQESQLWTQLHQGLLTTGRLNAALGFYEPAAAKCLGIPRDRVNHHSLLSAAANLQMPSYGLELLDLPAQPAIFSQITASCTAAAPGMQNAITVSEYEAEAIKLANASLTGGGSGSKNRRRKSRKQQQQQATGKASPAAASAAAFQAPSVEAEAVLDPYATADSRRKRCTTVATRGDAPCTTTKESACVVIAPLSKHLDNAWHPSALLLSAATLQLLGSFTSV